MKNELAYKFEWSKGLYMDFFPWKKDSPCEFLMNNSDLQSEQLNKCILAQMEYIKDSKAKIENILKPHESAAILKYEPNGLKIEKHFDVSSILVWFSVLRCIGVERHDLISLKKEEMLSILVKLIDTGANVALAQKEMPNLLLELGKIDYNMCITLVKNGWDPSAPLMYHAKDLHSDKTGCAHLEPNAYCLLADTYKSDSLKEANHYLFSDFIKECVKQGLDLESMGTRGYSALGFLMHIKPINENKFQEEKLLALIECGADLNNVNQHHLVLNCGMKKLSAMYAANQLKKHLEKTVETPNQVQKIRRTM